MAIALLAEDDLVLADQANACFDRVDEALRCLFSGCSPILWMGLSGAGSYQAAGMCGVLFVFGTIGSRKILSSISSHDQDAIDSAVAAASTYGASPQDDVRKQVGLNLATGYLRNSLVTQTRLCTPPSGPDEPYWVRVPLVSVGGTQYWQHEHPHELAVAEVIFEGHADREFLWKEEWTKFACIRFHNLDSDAEDLVITMESTGEKISVPRWGVKAVRLNAAGTSWVEEGFLLFRMRSEDVDRFGGTLPWNPRSEVIGGATYESVWTSDAANNVASFASLWRWIDWFSTSATPAEYLDTCGDGLADAFDPRTGIHFDLSDITRNSYRLPEWPDPTASGTLLYQLAWHGGAFYLYRKPSTGAAAFVSVSATLDQLIAGHAGSNLTLSIYSGTTARLHITTETGLDYYDLVPISTNLGASGHPFNIDADGVGYTLPSCTIGGPDIRRLTEDTVSESVTGIGTMGEQDYTFLAIENAWSGVAIWNPWTADIGDVQGWTFADATKNNAHCTFLTNSVKWDGRRLAINVELQVEPDAGACPDADAAAYFGGTSVSNPPSFITASGALSWYQAAVVQDWPDRGGIWLVREYRRRKIAQISPPIYHPHTDNPFGNAAGDDWQGKDTGRFPTGSDIARQLPLGSVESADLSDSYLIAPDSTDTIVAGIRSLDATAASWWASNRSAALAGDPIGAEVRPAIAVPLMARHFNVLAQRLNAISEVIPFTFLDAQWYGRPFRPTNPGIYDGHVYPEGFLCVATGTAATRATDLGASVTDFATEYAALAARTESDLDSSLAEDDPFTHPEAFRIAGAGGIDLWSTDLPLWFNPLASITPKERTIVSKDDAGDIAAAGWTQGELAGTFGLGDDFYWYWKPTAHTFPDFEYLTVASIASVASDLGIPFRLLRLSATFDVALCTPDGDGEFGVRTSINGTVDGIASVAVKRQELRLVAGVSHQFEAFAGTGELWAPGGLVRVADWALHPDPGDHYATTDAAARQSVTNPMHNLDRGSGSTPPQWGSAAWQNGDPFEAEAESVRIQVWDTCPAAPTGWTKAAHRVGSYPVPIVQWGATDIEAQSAPAVPPKWHDVSGLGEFVSASDLWVAAGGSGAWSGSGAFGVHLLGAGYRPA